MTVVKFDLGDTSVESGVYIDESIRFSLSDFAKEIIELGEDAFRRKYKCFGRPTARNIINQQQNSRATVKQNSPVQNTSNKTKYNVTIGEDLIIEGANKIQMVTAVLESLIKYGYTPTQLVTSLNNRYFKFPLLKAFNWGADRDEITKSLGKDSARYGLKYCIEKNKQKWIPCSQWTPVNIAKFIADINNISKKMKTPIVIEER